MMSVAEKLALDGCCCYSSRCKSSLRNEGAAYAVTWAWTCWDKSVLHSALLIGGSEMEC